jgi:hypothetical protein
MKTLSEFVKECGTQQKAANKLGVPLNTLWRWLHGRKISQLAQMRLSSKGVSVGKDIY